MSIHAPRLGAGRHGGVRAARGTRESRASRGSNHPAGCGSPAWAGAEQQSTPGVLRDHRERLRNALGRLIEDRLDPDTILPVTRTRHFVVFDLRGTGFSEPALCRDFADAVRPVEKDAGSAAARERRRAAVRRSVTQLRAQGIDRSAYNAVERAADLADLRRALGYSTWMCTAAPARVVLEALRRQPQGVRSTVLENPSRPGPALAERPLWAARALQAR